MEAIAYAVILEPEAEGGFSVSVPSFPEIHTQGEDIEDALAMARDAIQLSLAVRKDEGAEIPASDADAIRVERVVVPAA
ncbi:MAG: type II toxin-antitoxin system HicB family antitoxin [Candidatus Eremiobacteraeota bacterium]|nr:type II toxin-antitoxin system HicB family antitoxin [Candidatus Eremiobacteraeota bacterium]